MSDRPRESTPSFDVPVARLADAVCDHFEDAWRRGERPVLRKYLDGVSAAVLPELLRLDVHYRRQAGEHPEAADYRDQVPEHVELVERFFARARTITFTGEPRTTGPETVDDGGVKSVQGDAAFEMSPDLPEKEATPRTAIPGYEILGELGRGGMGVVYKARHIAFDRIVALKMILNSEYADEAELARFRVEAEAVARLQHPGIVQVFEGGEHEGTPFLSLEYVDGGNLASTIKGEPQPAKQAAEMVEQLARAMHHAHEQGVVHRDLKPGNVLLTASGTPKVTDFGLAKKLDAAHNLSQTGAIMGTPSYMAPEQALGLVKQIGPAADVYALGAILYELLTGRPPFKGATLLDTLAQVVNDEPVPPSRLVGRVPVDLETVCLKCLQKEPRRRYVTAKTLADDLGRSSRGEPILARPVGRFERARKWVNRNPVVAGLTAAVVMVLLAGTVVATTFAIQAGRNADEAERRTAAEQKERERAEANKRLADERLESAKQNLLTTQLMRVESVYKLQPQKALELLHDTTACPIYLRDSAWHFYDNYCRRGLLLGHTGLVTTLSFSPDGKTLVSGSDDKTVKLWDVTTGQVRATLQGHAGAVHSVSFSSDGKTVASGSDDKTVKLWDLATGESRTLHTEAAIGGVAVAFSPDGKSLAAGLRGMVMFWEVATGKCVVKIHDNELFVSCLAFSNDGKFLATVGPKPENKSGEIRLWNLATREAHSLVAPFGGEDLYCLAFSPDGKTLAAGSGSFQSPGQVYLWDLATGKDRTTFQGHTASVVSISFSPDGKSLVSGSSDGTIRVWDLATGQARMTLSGHGKSANSVALSPDAGVIASANDNTVKLWHAANGPECYTLFGHERAVRFLCFSPDGNTLTSGSSEDMTLKSWKLSTGQARKTPNSSRLVADTSGATFIPHSNNIATGGRDHIVRLWDLSTGQGRALISEAFLVAVSPDGKTLATQSRDKTVKLWDLTTGKAGVSLAGGPEYIRRVAFSPDGRTLVTGDEATTVKLWDLATGRTIATLDTEADRVDSLAYSPDGKSVAIAMGGGSVKMWDLATGQTRMTLSGHSKSVTSMVFSPDGMTLASGSSDRTVRLFHVATGQARAILTGHTGDVIAVAFSNDGKILASGSVDCTVKLWDVGNGQSTLPPLFDPVPYWHREQLALAEKEKNAFVAAFHQGRLAGFEPWDATLRLKEAEAWAKAGQNERAARAFLQAVLLDPRVGERR